MTYEYENVLDSLDKQSVDLREILETQNLITARTRVLLERFGQMEGREREALIGKLNDARDARDAAIADAGAANGELLAFTEQVARALGMEQATSSTEAVLAELHAQQEHIEQSARGLLQQRLAGDDRANELESQLTELKEERDKAVYQLMKARARHQAFVDQVATEQDAVRDVGKALDAVSEVAEAKESQELRLSYRRMVRAVTGDADMEEWAAYGQALAARQAMTDVGMMRALVSHLCTVAEISDLDCVNAVSIRRLSNAFESRFSG